MLPIVLILLLDNTYPSGLFVPGPMHCAVDSVEVLLASVLSNGAVVFVYIRWLPGRWK